MQKVFPYAVFFLPCCTILAHKRTFFNVFLIKSPTKINPASRIVRDVTIVTSTGGHYVMIENHRETFIYKGAWKLWYFIMTKKKNLMM